MKHHFILFTALRYFKARRRSKGFTSSLLSILGVAVGIMTLTTVIAIMNGFQLNFISNLLEVSSYHIQIAGRGGKLLDSATLDAIKKIPEITAVVPFRELQVIVDRESEISETMPGILRAVDQQSAASDESFIRHLFGQNYEPGEYAAMVDDFAIQEPNTVLVGALFARYLGVRRGSRIIISSINDLSLKAGMQILGEAASRTFTVSGIFKTGYRDIDSSYLFISLGNSLQFLSNDSGTASFPVNYGIKLRNLYGDREVKAQIEKLLNKDDFEVKTWRDFNRSFFSALFTEKLTMLILVGLIFIVVGFNIFNSLRRIVYEKFEEIALLKAIGASPSRIRTIFIFEGLLIGFLGGLIGIVFGLFTARNINEICSFFTGLGNAILDFCEQAVTPFGARLFLGRLECPFSPKVFYLQEVPSVVIFEEAVFIYLFAVLSSVGAAFFASRKISEVKPSEVLRYE
jgi:lipoprotein-releasing system permease protein